MARAATRLAPLFLILLSLLLSAAPAFADPSSQAASATLSVLGGSVTVVDGSSGAAAPGASGQTLSEGARVLTGPDGRAVITFVDGSEVELQPGTEVRLGALRQSGQTTLVVVQQAVGVTLNRVAQLGADSSYQLETPSMTAYVRGTRFRGTVDRSRATGNVVHEEIVLEEGVLRVRVKNQSRLLRRGERIVVNTPDRPGGDPRVITEPSSQQETSPPGASGLDRALGMDEGWRNLDRLRESGAGTDRITFAWNALEPNGPESFQPDLYLPPERLQAEIDAGIEVVGLIQFTPAWAARNPEQGERAVPRGLGDPNGPWSQFVHRLASHYRGRIDTWIVWNEPDFRQGDSGGGGSWTWSGSDEEYWQLFKDASRAIRQANPDARVILGPSSYWVDISNNRELFLRRLLRIAARDPETRANDWFFDAVGINIYRAPDDIYRVYGIMHDILREVGIAKPLWLTELNCMPFDDPATPKPDDQQRCTLQEQAAFTLQAYALALAAGWERALWYQLTDNHIWQQQEVWGLVRDDGSERPAFQSFRVASHYFSHADRFAFRPLTRSSQPWGTPWPDDPGSYYPNWQVYQVLVDRGSQRIHVLWNADGQPLRVRIPRQGSGATLVDKFGNSQPLAPHGAWYVVELPPASAVGPFDPPGYHYVGGDPFLIVQEDVPPDAPLVEPARDTPS